MVCSWGDAGADADDVAQQVFQSVATHLADFRRDREGDTFCGWMRVITENIIRHHYRRLSRGPKTCGGPSAWVMLQGIADPCSETFYVDPDALDAQHLRRRALEMIRLQFEERTWTMFWETFIKERSLESRCADGSDGGGRAQGQVPCVAPAQERILRSPRRGKIRLAAAFDCLLSE